MTSGYNASGYDEEEEEEEKVWLSSINAVIYVVDCSTDMLVKDSATGLSPMCLALETIRNVYCTKLITGSRDNLAVVLSGTDKQYNGHSGLHLLLPLDVPDRTCVTELDQLINESENVRYGAGKDYNIYNLLWTCNSLYNTCTKKLAIRQIMMFTNISKPLNIDTKTIQMSITKARDMAEIGIDIILIPLKPTNGSEFNIDHFYGSLLPSDTELIAPTSDLEDLTARVHRREKNLRMSGEIPFILGPGLQMGVKMYNIVAQDKTKQTFISMCAKTNEQVFSVSNEVREDNRTLLLPHEVYRKCSFGSEELIFDVEEMKEMVQLRDKGLYLIGFKPRSHAVKLHHQVTKSIFVRPSENLVAGSNNLFIALLERCITREVVPVCHSVPRSGSYGMMVVLIPKEEKRDKDNEQIQAAGFNMIQLPYADDLRKIDVEPTPAPSNEELQTALKLVSKLSIKKFSPQLIESPELTKFQNTLEAIALEKGSVNEIEDLTLPDINGIDTRASVEIAQFNQIIFPDNYRIPEACRKPDYRLVIGKVQDASRSKTLHKVTVSDLRLYCKGVGLSIPSAANKADLLDAVKRFIG